MRTTCLRMCLAVMLVCASLGVANAQDFIQQDSPAFWGTGTNFHFVGAEEFQTLLPRIAYWSGGGDGFWGFDELGAGTKCSAAARLPTGSLITGMTVIYRDDDGSSSSDVSVDLEMNWVAADTSVGTTTIASFQSSGAPGIAATWVDIDPDHTVRYIDGTTAQSYVLTAFMFARNELKLRGVIVGWNRQVSPAPATATFADVPTGHPFFQFVEALAESGITAGCGGGNYCPDDPLTRGQMAVFLSAALGLHWSP